MGADGEPICNCERGYTGTRCEQCQRGYVGNPLQPGGYCTPEKTQSHCDARGTLRQHRKYRALF